MPFASFRVTTEINASIERVFDKVADLTTHGEWSANPLTIDAITPGPVELGSRYRSTAQVNGMVFQAELRVTEWQPPQRFAFSGADRTGQFEHQFTLQSHGGSTWLERKVTVHVTFPLLLMYLILLYPIRVPAARKALQALKRRLEP